VILSRLDVPILPLTAHAEDWKNGALGVINAVLKEPLKLSVLNVVGGGDQAWAVVELEAKSGVCKNGMSHRVTSHFREMDVNAKRRTGMPYEQRYAWVMRFDEQGTIVQVRQSPSAQASMRLTDR